MLVPTHAIAKNIKVGVVDCYSGPPAPFSKDALNGFKLGLKEINKEGVLGKKIEYTTRDSKFKVDIGLSAAKELVMREDVDLLVGIISSSTAMAVSNYVKGAKVPLIVWIAKSGRITGEKGHRYVFSTGDNTSQGGKAGAVALSKKPYIKYWIAGDDYEFGHALGKASWNNLKKLKPEVQKIGESWWKVGEPDLIPYLTAIMAAKPDAVIFATGAASMVNAMKAAKSTGMNEKVAIWVHTATDHSLLKPLGDEAPLGVLGTMDHHFYYPDTPENKKFVDAFEAEYGTKPGFPAFHGYNTANFIAKAYKKAGVVDKEKFIDALEGLKIDSPVGELEMRACDHQVVLPMFLGEVGRSPKYPDFAISVGITTLPGNEIMPTCEEIAEARKKK